MAILCKGAGAQWYVALSRPPLAHWSRSWLQDTSNRKLVDFAWNRRFFYLPGACSPLFRSTRLKVSINPIFYIRSACFDQSLGQPRVSPGKQGGGRGRTKSRNRRVFFSRYLAANDGRTRANGPAFDLLPPNLTIYYRPFEWGWRAVGLCFPCLRWWGRLCRRRCAAGGCARAVLMWGGVSRGYTIIITIHPSIHHACVREWVGTQLPTCLPTSS